jgi:pre-rRNA-processing protein TSR1
MPHGGFFAASVFGPITYQPSSVLMFKETTSPTTGVVRRQLVAMGSLSEVNPDRLIVKRVVLSGAPVRVKKCWATIRHMFFNPDDVRFFKPAELYTKHGLQGYIKEPVGTHGLFKGTFSKPIKQHDTICLSLYKRVYPRWVEGLEESPSAQAIEAITAAGTAVDEDDDAAMADM